MHARCATKLRGRSDWVPWFERPGMAGRYAQPLFRLRLRHPSTGTGIDHLWQEAATSTRPCRFGELMSMDVRGWRDVSPPCSACRNIAPVRTFFEPESRTQWIV